MRTLLILAMRILNMKNSINTKSVVEILHKIKNDDEISIIIGRIDAVRDIYLTTHHSVKANSEFNKEISSFVSRAYSNGLKPAKYLNEKAALAESIWLLDLGYKSEGATGYYAALIDATNPGNDKFGLIIHYLADTIKAIEIRRYTDYLYHSLINPNDADTHIEIVKYLIKKNKSIIPSYIHKRCPSQFIKYYRELIEIDISAENLLKKATLPRQFDF